jgi:hypothetical protein
MAAWLTGRFSHQTGVGLEAGFEPGGKPSVATYLLVGDEGQG